MVRVRDSGDDRQPEAGTTVVASTGHLSAAKTLERVRQELLREPRTTVTHGDLDPSVTPISADVDH
jgi:hypothetical protein